MPSIASLMEYVDPIDAAAPRDAMVNLFSDASSGGWTVVVERGRPVGIVTREAARGRDPDQPLTQWMGAPVCVEANLDIEAARALLLDASSAELVVVDAGRYLGIVSAGALWAHGGEPRVAAEDNRRFIERVSHEARAPMSGVLAVAELLQRQVLPTESQAHVRTIIESSQAALRALNDALELTRAEAGELELDTADALLRDVMDQVQTTWQARAAQDGVTLMVAYDGDPHLSARIDANRVKQVFDKLIEAALSLSRRGVVEASLAAAREPGGVRLTGRVRDTGGGLSAAKLARVFDGAAPGGAEGLGLALCRRIVERMDGTIRAESNVGAGTTVVFDCLATETVIEDAPSDNAVTAGARMAHVLVVDDNATNRMVAEALCEMFDCTSECVEDGAEAVDAARTGRFDLILMDIRMPRMDGVEATLAIRAFPGPAGAVPIIALTANADPEDAQGYLKCGMQEVVEKPIKPERLLKAINAALSDSPKRAAA